LQADQARTHLVPVVLLHLHLQADSAGQALIKQGVPFGLPHPAWTPASSWICS
jgi:hypothetical protein